MSSYRCNSSSIQVGVEGNLRRVIDELVENCIGPVREGSCDVRNLLIFADFEDE